MQKNPYKFIGPLDPVEDKIVCCPRLNEINKVISSIRQGDYWTILGPRQIGKTTFLRQIRSELSIFPSVYIDFEVSPKTEENFYNWIIEIITHVVDNIELNEKERTYDDYEPELKFLNFLKSIKIKDNKKIILLFDEIEKTPLVRSFLHIWRKVFHERYDQDEFKKYTVILAGSVELVPLTVGEISPFNIAQKLYLSNFTFQETERLIDDPLKIFSIELNLHAKREIINQTSGHPQLLQHLCHILVDQIKEESRLIKKEDVDKALYRLYVENDNIKM
ncbi:MAG: AAA-like domain-containing protein, partial [Candidatus Hodarchaeota archaeon]